MTAEWPTLALFWYAPHATGSVADPIFGKPLNFFLFTLPAWQLVDNWLLTLAIAICAVAVLFLVITSGARSLAKRQITYGPSPWRGLSITVAFLLLVLAMNVYVDRFQLLLEHHTIFDGITYTDAHITIHGLLIVCAALVLGAIIAAWQCDPESPWTMDCGRHRSCRSLLWRPGDRRLVRRQLHRQAERARSRRTLYRAQHSR